MTVASTMIRHVAIPRLANASGTHLFAVNLLARRRKKDPVTAERSRTRLSSMLVYAIPGVVLCLLAAAVLVTLPGALFDDFEVDTFLTIQPGTTDQQVRDLLGEPDRIHEQGSGLVIWEYRDGFSETSYYVHMLNKTVFRIDQDR